MMGKNKFKSAKQARGCTTETEVDQFENFNVYNIPGLLEADPKRIAINVEQLKKAFEGKEKSFCIYVLTVEGGRVRDSDYSAYKALTVAYTIEEKSFCFLVNKLEDDDPINEIDDYIKEILGNFPIYHLNKTAEKDAEKLSKEWFDTFHKIFRKCQAGTIVKKQELSFDKTLIEELKAESRKQMEKYEEMLTKEKEEHERRLALLEEKRDKEAKEMKLAQIELQRKYAEDAKLLQEERMRELKQIQKEAEERQERQRLILQQEKQQQEKEYKEYQRKIQQEHDTELKRQQIEAMENYKRTQEAAMRYQDEVNEKHRKELIQQQEQASRRHQEAVERSERRPSILSAVETIFNPFKWF